MLAVSDDMTRPEGCPWRNLGLQSTQHYMLPSKLASFNLDLPGKIGILEPHTGLCIADYRLYSEHLSR